MGSVRETYLIVGAGLFGASTALHLIRSSPSAIVILLDRTPFPCPSAASHDLNKIIRAGYDDIFYVKLALEALKLWRSDPIYQPYYHESGMLFSEYWGMGRAAFEHYNTIGDNFNAEMTTPEAAKARFPMFRGANWDDVRENFFDARAGWADAAPCLRNLIQAALEEGVAYIAEPVSTISRQTMSSSALGLTQPSYLLTAPPLTKNSRLTAGWWQRQPSLAPRGWLPNRWRSSRTCRYSSMAWIIHTVIPSQPIFAS
jgi:glycine/D-amino acid oxidase-like deaminating enzyme